MRVLSVMGVIQYADEPFEVSVPICLVGAGGCGLTAAVSAAKLGGNVLVLESDASPMGSTGMTIGLVCAAGTKLQASLGIDDSAERLVEVIMKATLFDFSEFYTLIGISEVWDFEQKWADQES